MSDDEEDPILVERASSGNATAFEALFRRHYDAVRAFAFRLCMDSGAADDIAQETFIKAARGLGKFRGEATFRNWLFRIAMNATRDWQRSAIRSRRATEELAECSANPHPTDFGRVNEALAALAADLRHAVALVYFEELSHAESARILGCAETTVSWRIFRAKRQLKKILASKGGPK